MDWLSILLDLTALWTPQVFAVLTGVAVAFLWFALAPSMSKRIQDGRLDGYLQGGDIIEDVDMQRSFIVRAVVPTIKKVLHTLGALTPGRDVESLRRLLLRAGQPAGLSAPDVLGLQILLAVGVSGLVLFLMQVTNQLGQAPTLIVVRNVGIAALLGYILPRLWLRMRADRRQREISRTFSDALDLLSVSVEAGLAFDSALMRVCERWQNALTEEFQRAVMEMRVGTPRNVALQRMADRTGVQEVGTFVGVLIQSTEMGVSISQTLHSQAAQMRIRRRQRAEELARQASIKMIFALVFLIFPALLVVLLGPGIPAIFRALGTMGGGTSPVP